jgi:hypothetical protein
MKITHYFLYLCAALAGTSTAYAAEAPPAAIKQLETVSEHIGDHTNLHAVSDSLYQQMRPHILVRDKKLSRTQVDKKVRSYITKKFAPVLIMNYSLIHSKMKKANKHFSRCDQLQAFAFDDHTMMALCTTRSQGMLNVHYMIKASDNDWKTMSVFAFRKTQQKLTLVGILLDLKKEQKVRVAGL